MTTTPTPPTPPSTPPPAAPPAAAANPDVVELTIDGTPVSVPKGTNLIEAAKTVGIEIPHYCYHQNLSVAGNCRMCQVQVKGAPKLEIACNCAVKPGMEVSTQKTSQIVKDAQSATLEFILINHPLDCTICDQAGHCKLQDYHFAYNAKESRFLEDKEHKPKAVKLGPTVTLDAERCIMCTRCVRFCDEVTKTSELGLLNRGDRSVISIQNGHELNNELSGTVVDLCPVGALTHSEWRFNTRIWFTKQADAICPGCSTGCNVKVASRDGEIVQVKARNNQAVNKEWLCDEGRYGFGRFLPESRITKPLLAGVECKWDAALEAAGKISECLPSVVFVSPDLTLEEYATIKQFVGLCLKHATVAIAYRERPLTEVQKILVSPDYAANFRGAELSGLVSGNLTSNYEIALSKVRHKQAQGVLVIGDRAVLPEDRDPAFLEGLAAANCTVALLTTGSVSTPVGQQNNNSNFAQNFSAVFPARSILEKSGIMVNRMGRIQYSERCLEPKVGTEADWHILVRLARLMDIKLNDADSDRALTMKLLATDDRFKSLKISSIKPLGATL